MTSTLIAFAPWILYWTLTGARAPVAALIAGLVVSAALTVRDLQRGRVKAMGTVSLAFFAAGSAATVLFGSRVFLVHGVLLTNLALAAMAWGTLLAGSPFTLQHAREGWPAAYWRNPLFRRTNAIITAVWAGAFSLNALLGLVPGPQPPFAAAVPHMVVAGALAFTIVFSRWYPRRRLAAEVVARDPYRWAPPAFGVARGGDESRHDAIVVGAGIGGLTAAALLTQRGLRVLVCEQHFLPGGFCTAWERVVRVGDARLRYVFDAGVHDVSGLGEHGTVRNLLRRLDLEDRLEWRPMSHEYILPDLRLRVPRRAEDFVTLLGERFPREREAIRRFFGEIEGVYREMFADVDRTGGVPRFPETVEEMLEYPLRHPTAAGWMQVPFGDMLDAYLRDPALKRFLSVLTGYLSDDPTTLTVGEMAPIFGYYFDGGHYFAGSSQTFADVLVRAIEEGGGSVRLRTPVRRILVERGRAAGVTLANGEIHGAEAVVSNADVRKTFLDLVGPEHLPPDFRASIERLRPSASAFMVFLGVDVVPDVAPLTFVSDGRDGLGIAIPSLVDPSLAPPGHSAVCLVKLVAQSEAVTWDRRAPGYRRRKHDVGDAMIALAERAIPKLSRHVVYRQEGSPPTFARYAWTTGGAIYGPVGQRPPAKSPIEGLVLAGAGVFPGAGVEAVVISGTLAADALCPVERRAAELVGTGRPR